MIKLSDRLFAMANFIKEDESIIDVGTDHGYLPIYLFENNISPKIILSDISLGSLNKAKDNIEKYCPNSNLILRLGDGIKVLEKGEVDDVVIAGMGGLLISDIIGSNIEKSYSFKKYILQPRNHAGDLRKFLNNNGFEITNEVLVREGKFICEILVAKPSKVKANDIEYVDGKIEWEVPQTLLNFQNDLLIEYIERKINTEENILAKLIESSKGNEKIEVSKKRLCYLEKLKVMTDEI